MATCVRCGCTFEVATARPAYVPHFGGDLDDADFDESYGEEVCGPCAIADAESNINLGRAIDMVNGEEAYDADFVERNL